MKPFHFIRFFFCFVLLPTVISMRCHELLFHWMLLVTWKSSCIKTDGCQVKHYQLIHVFYTILFQSVCLFIAKIYRFTHLDSLEIVKIQFNNDITFHDYDYHHEYVLYCIISFHIASHSISWYSLLFSSFDGGNFMHDARACSYRINFIEQLLYVPLFFECSSSSTLSCIQMNQ